MLAPWCKLLHAKSLLTCMPPTRDLLPGLKGMASLEELQLDTDAVLVPCQLDLLQRPALPASLQRLLLQPGQEHSQVPAEVLLALRRQLPGVEIGLLPSEAHE